MGNFDRLCYINRYLQQGRPLTTRQIAEHFEISTRQVKRDIDHMRTRLDAPIVYDKDERGLVRSIPVSSYKEIPAKILSFGSLARPIAPKELVTLWRAEVDKMAAQ